MPLMRLVVFTAIAFGLPALATPFVYVPNTIADTNTVSVIDSANNRTVATILVGPQPLATAATRDGRFVYVVNATYGNPGTVSVISTATNKVIKTIPVGANPMYIAVSRTLRACM